MVFLQDSEQQKEAVPKTEEPEPQKVEDEEIKLPDVPTEELEGNFKEKMALIGYTYRLFLKF